MKVTDINGFQIEITDLNEAIEDAEYFKDCHHIPPTESDKERQKYWADMHEKLKAIKEKSNNN